MITRRNFRKAERGQALILCALFMFVLLLFVGLAIDFGFAYVTRAQLGKAADAAALTAARYSAKGQTTATLLAKSAFAMNYNSSTLDYTAAPVVNVGYSTDSSGNALVNVNVIATTKTFFAGLLPAFTTLNVASSAQSKAARVVMTLVLDRTGSMIGDLGSTYLPGAVTDFISYFNNATDGTGDYVAVVTFANNVTVDVPMVSGGGGFQQSVINDANGLNYQGATWSDGALQLALTTENAYSGPASLQKAVVFFTDGNANTVQGNLTCNGSGNLKSGTWNFGGSDDSAYIGFVTTNNRYYKNGANCPISSGAGYPLNGNPNSFCQTQNNGSNNACNGLFQPLVGKPEALNWTNVTLDARNRAINDANNMRAAGITVYSIGLGNDADSVDTTFLCEVANDPCSPTYNAALPSGAMQFVSSAVQLDQAFQAVAATIRLKLTQ